MKCVKPLQPGVSYVNPPENKNLKGFQMFSGGADKQNWAIMA